MSESERLIDVLKRNQWIIEKQIDGLDHQDSLLQTPFRGNCLNWVLGHLAVHRDKILDLLGENALLDKTETSFYQRGSSPITCDTNSVRLETLSNALKEGVERISTALAVKTDDDLSAICDEEKCFTLADKIDFLIWHDTYHTGQIEYLRQLAGKDDSVIP